VFRAAASKHFSQPFDGDEVAHARVRAVSRLNIAIEGWSARFGEA
jgi:hypothetical protein